MNHEVHLSHRSNWLRAAVLGANDGIVSTASLVLGVAASGASGAAIVTAGIAGLVAGALSMAAGEYVSVSSQRDAEQADIRLEERELRSDPQGELRELAGLYEHRGLPPALASEVASALSRRGALQAHLRDELGLDQRRLARPFQAAWASAVSFSTGAALPLLAVALAPANGANRRDRGRHPRRAGAARRPRRAPRRGPARPREDPRRRLGRHRDGDHRGHRRPRRHRHLTHGACSPPRRAADPRPSLRRNADAARRRATDAKPSPSPDCTALPALQTRRINRPQERKLVMSKLFQYGGIVASIILIAFGAGSIVTGYNGRDRVHNDLAREQIVGTPDSSIPNQLVNNGTKAEAFAKVMRKHTLEATGGQTYAQMGRYMGKNGKPTNDEKPAAVDPKSGKPVDNPLRNLWVTETALTTALHSSYFAESVATFAMVMGFALMLVGGGFLVLTLRVLRVFEQGGEGDRACGRAKRGRALELISREQGPA